jgi:predicted acyl esterase
LGSDVSEWPLARTRFTDFYLHGAGALTTDPPREARCATTYQFDPARPVVHRRQRVIVARRAVAAPPASRIQATPAAASAPPTSCARAASTSVRPQLHREVK